MKKTLGNEFGWEPLLRLGYSKSTVGVWHWSFGAWHLSLPSPDEVFLRQIVASPLDDFVLKNVMTYQTKFSNPNYCNPPQKKQVIHDDTWDFSAFTKLIRQLRLYVTLWWWCTQKTARWWQLKYFGNFHPENFGRWTQFDLRIFFRWVGSTQPPTRQRRCRFPCFSKRSSRSANFAMGKL